MYMPDQLFHGSRVAGQKNSSRAGQKKRVAVKKKTGRGSKNRSRVEKNGSPVIFSMSDPILFQLPKQRPEVLAQRTAE